MKRMDTGEPYTYVRRQVGRTVKGLCERDELSQSELAAMTGINRSYLNELIAGKANPSLDKLVRVADGLGVPLTELFAGLDGVAPSALEYDGAGRNHDESAAGAAGKRPGSTGRR